MTTAQSSLKVLRKQAAQCVEMLKKAERGEKLPNDPAGKVIAARTKPTFSFVIAMDDKVLNIEISWIKIRNTTTPALVEYLLDQMCEERGTIQ